MITHLLKNSLKFAFSGAIIFALAFLVAVLFGDSPSQVPEAQADLTDLMPASSLKHQDFHRVLLDAGFEPRPHDYNGNIVYFAAADSPLDPQDFAQAFQQRLVSAGINSQIYDVPSFNNAPDEEMLLRHQFRPESRLRNQAMLNGELVPVFSDDEIATLAGVVPHQGFNSPEELVEIVKTLGARQRFTPAHYMRGFRLIEARRNPVHGGSTVTATWSDNTFDATKITDPQAIDVRLDAQVPTCLGCSRQNRLESLSDDAPYVLNQYHTTSPGSHVRQFYLDAMQNRGWELSGSDQILLELEQHIPELQHHGQDFLTFERDDEYVSFYISEGLRTDVMAIRSRPTD